VIRPMRRLFRFRLWHLLVAVALAAAALTPIAALRRRVAHEQAALHEALMMGGSVSRDETPTSYRQFLDYLAGGPTLPVTGLSFQNQDEPYDSWGPYGPGGKAVQLRKWTPENIDRLGAALPNLPQLVNLSFWKTSLPSGALPKLVPHSTRLRYLGLEETDVTDEEVKQVLSRTPNLTNLDLSSTNVTDDVMPAVSRLKNLAFLRLENTRITDAGLASLRGLPIQVLDLGLTRISEQSSPLLIDMQVAETLLVPAEWSPEEIKWLREASPTGSDIRATGYRFSDRPDAKAQTPGSEAVTRCLRIDAEEQ
jgi:hypothetical protein